MQIFQKGFNYSQDGQGNRLVYHLQGCNMRCPWCSNPEGMEFLQKTHKEVAEIVNEALLCKPIFFDGGGVTFTGGECTCQFDALKNTLTLLKQNNINTAIETNGTHLKLPELFNLLDELIIDCKHYNSATHKKFTGISNETIINNIAKAAKYHPNVLIRIPLIGGFNASIKDIENFANFFKSIGAFNAKIELLSYHEYGKDKWRQCGKTYTVQNAFITTTQHKTFEQILKTHGLNVVRT